MADGTGGKRNWGSRTRAVRSGLERTRHCETSEALFLTSGLPPVPSAMSVLHHSGHA